MKPNSFKLFMHSMLKTKLNLKDLGILVQKSYKKCLQDLEHQIEMSLMQMKITKYKNLLLKLNLLINMNKNKILVKRCNLKIGKIHKKKKPKKY